MKNKKNKPKGEAEEAAEQAKEARKDLIKSCKKASRFEQLYILNKLCAVEYIYIYIYMCVVLGNGMPAVFLCNAIAFTRICPCEIELS